MGVDHSGSPDVLPEQDRWRVRIRDADGAVLGAGILLGTRHVLTCAHVLLRSDDRGTEDTAPDINVVIDFVGLREVPPAKARVAAGGWVPPNDADGGDIALLELDQPQPTGSTTPLRRLPATRGRAVYTCGFPSGLEDGMWVDATLAGHSGPGRERVQMNARWAGQQVRAGFSGAPVFDNATGYVIGMVVGAYTDEEVGISHMLPVETIISHLPRVTEWVSGAKASDPTLFEKLTSQKLDDDLARKIVPWIQRHRYTDNTWMFAGLVPLPVLDFPDPATRILENPAVSEPPKLTAGDLVANQYKVVGCLARGGLGWVYLARDTHLDDNYVALKAQINIKDVQAVAREVAERRFLTMLDHPNIVRIFNFVTHREPSSGELTGYIVMEYVGGLSLGEVREMAAEHQDPLGGPLLVEHIIAYGIEILGALDYLHRHGLLYCDMKPSNVIRSANRIKIINLGAVRRVDDRQSPIVQTPGFGVGREENRTRGLTVQSDIHTVGKTLEDLFNVSADVRKPVAAPDSGQVSFGIESFRRALERATHERANRRFPSAAAMSQQLRGVLREILSLRDGQPRPEPSTMFTVTAALLDAGLGMVPPLESWTTNRAVERGTTLFDGRPSAAAVAVGLPAPRVDADDPAADFLATVSATASRRLIDQLSTFQQESVEIQLCECRAHLELADLEKAHRCLGSAAEILGKAADYDWRMAWHHGLLALANDKIADAESQFTEVYRALPGEDAPKLALGFCCEQLDKLDDAEHYYGAVWRRDPSQASAAFGLARIFLRRGNRDEAVTILDEVPNISRHHDAARIAAVRILSGRLAVGTGNGNGLPTAADFRAVISRLPALCLDGGDKHGAGRDRLTAAVREVALAWVRETGGDGELNGHGILGDHVSERGLRELLEESFRALAGQARNRNDHGVLIGLANEFRLRSRLGQIREYVLELAAPKDARAVIAASGEALTQEAIERLECELDRVYTELGPPPGYVSERDGVE